jgi:hypothetical protein
MPTIDPQDLVGKMLTIDPQGKMPTIDPQDLVGHSFLLPQQEDGQCFPARIVMALDDYESGFGAQDYGEGNVWKFCQIIGHQASAPHRFKVTGILHLLSKISLDWYSKKQATIETATYGFEFVAACTCVDQIVDLRTTLCYLSVPLRDKSYVFGDNKTVMDSSTIPHAKLHKRHIALSFHHVCEAIAAKFIEMHHLDGIFNPADILSKHWAYLQVWHNLKPLLFIQGDMAQLYDEC